MQPLRLSGRGLSPEALEIATHGLCKLEISDKGLARMAEARALVDRAVAEGTPVYGVTTGLGARATEVLDAGTLANFSRQTLEGRAQDMGAPLAPETVRATLIVRLNTMLLGHSGARPEVAEFLAQVINAGLTPEVGSLGSIGAGDLVINAAMGRTLLGEGEMRGNEGVRPSRDALKDFGLTPLDPAPRDGLALANHSGYSAALAAMTLAKATRVYGATQAAAALSLEAFRANLGPFEDRVLAVKPLPGQGKAAAHLRELLDGSSLWVPGAARRLQDPLSFRNIPQIHGGLETALAHLRQVVEIELNGSSDNPITLAEDEDILSCGGYHTTELALAAEGVSRAWQHVAMGQVARIARMMEPELTGLLLFLAKPDSGSNGFAPLLKVVEALAAEITQAAQPVPVWPSINARGVEDALSAGSATLNALSRSVEMAAKLSAIELVVAAQGVDFRETSQELGGPMRDWHARVRRHVAPLGCDRPLGREIDALSEALHSFTSPEAK
ncbi:HAL/PAL/TAL family ammonia-lyase [Roseovarius phycicola]|uniref:Aromatic amino acid ammonia-lyase n=1 Tax=Roseovarius phycicola TaxID=3080976 RepID=A0ABZ2HKD9_9RHOB